MRVIQYTIEVSVPDDESESSLDRLEEIIVKKVGDTGFTLYHHEHCDLNVN